MAEAKDQLEKSADIAREKREREANPNLTRVNSYLERVVYSALQNEAVDANLRGEIRDEDLFDYGDLLAQFSGEKASGLLGESNRRGELSDKQIRETLDPEKLKGEFGTYLRETLDSLNQELQEGAKGGGWTGRLQEIKRYSIPQCAAALKVYKKIFS